MAERMVSLGRERPKKYREIEVLLFVLLYNIVQTKSTIHYYKIQQMEMMLQNSYLHHLSFLIFFLSRVRLFDPLDLQKSLLNILIQSLHTLSIYTEKNREIKKYCSFLQKNQTRAKIFVKLICFLFLGAEIQRKESLCPPPKRGCTWDEYIQSPAGQHPVLGRTPKCKESSRAFKATVAMSEDFPLTVDMLLNVLEVCMIYR